MEESSGKPQYHEKDRHLHFDYEYAMNLEYGKHHSKVNMDREKIRKLILAHPFFKNPNNYHIRLITIMKFLKRKGLDVRVKDIDLYVEEIILSIPNVKKIGDEKYSYRK